MRIVVISGTNRDGALSRRLSDHILANYKAADVEAELLDLAELPPELLLPTAYKAKPEAFTKSFVEPILAADGLHLVVPEYNGSFPGVLKLLIDHLPFPEAFERRPTAYTGLAAGQYGALRAVEQLQLVFGYRNAFNYPERVFIPGSYQVFTEGGEIADTDLASRLKRQSVGFADFVKALASVRTRPE
jgi:NAD(P)H-dependent FMN reductase